MAKNLKQQYSQIVKLFNSMIGAHQLWELWEDAMTIFALMLSNAIDKRFFDQREKEYKNLASKYSDNELQTFSKIFAEIVNQLEADPEQDLLGDLYMSLDLGSHWHGQFFTPYNVCAMMAQAQMPTDLSFDSAKPVSVFDCACGGGALLIAAAHEYRKTFSKIGFLLRTVTAYIVQNAVNVSCCVPNALQQTTNLRAIGQKIKRPAVRGIT